MTVIHLSLTLTTIMMRIGGTPPFLSKRLCRIPPPSNLVKSARALTIPTLRSRRSRYTRLSRLMKPRVTPRHRIMMTLRRRLFSLQPPSIAAFSGQITASQSLRQRLTLSKWHGTTPTRNLECNLWSSHQILQK